MVNPDNWFGDGLKGRLGRVVALLAVLIVPAIQPGAAVLSDPDTAEPGSVEAIAQSTTDPRFVSPWVAYVP